MIRAVIDTSVLVSAVISPTGPNAQLFDVIANKEIRPYVTKAVLAEYYDVFKYERLKYLDRRRIARLRGVLERMSIKVKSPGQLNISSHEEDNRIYECAVAAKADYIVTENTKHFKQPYKTTKIVNARQLLKPGYGRRRNSRYDQAQTSFCQPSRVHIQPNQARCQAPRYHHGRIRPQGRGLVSCPPA
jgi:uncharacterized protein